MKIYYHRYTLKPLKRANRLSSLEPKHGIHLRAELKNQVMFVDYFPHIPLGDRPCDHFLDEFKFQNIEYDQKVFQLLLKDSEFQKFSSKTFLNHQLWTGSESLEAPVVKYKMLHDKDQVFLHALEKGHRLRLDGNALFKLKDYEYFVNSLPKEYLKQIDYVEDPLIEKDWKDLALPSARDFIEGSPFDFYIYKPNCEFIPKTDKKIIFSAYLGSPLGNWHTYCELKAAADLTLTHGIMAEGFYEDEIQFLKGSYKEGFMAEELSFKRIYQNLHSTDWKHLCSM